MINERRRGAFVIWMPSISTSVYVYFVVCHPEPAKDLCLVYKSEDRLLSVIKFPVPRNDKRKEERSICDMDAEH